MDGAARTLSGFDAGQLFGVRIGVDWSLLIIFAVITFDLGAGLLPRWHPDWPRAVRWLVAVTAAVLFLGSLLAHELSHALMARRRGVPVRRITLFVFGGVAHLDEEPSSPTSELLIAVVGPMTSLGIGLLAMLVGIRVAGIDLARAAALEDRAAWRALLQQVSPLGTLFLWLGSVNVILALLNMVPGFPLDAGRVLRSAIWAVTRDLRKATRWASGAGQFVASCSMAIGVIDVLAGAWSPGLWLLLIGWFLNNAARQSYVQLAARQALASVRVAEVMRTRVLRVAPDLPLSDFVRDYVLASDQRTFPVESNGQWCGVARFDDVRALSGSDWAHGQVRDLMLPTSEAAALRPNTSAERALEELMQRDVDQLPVAEDGKVLGLLWRKDLLGWLALRGDLPGSRFHPAH